MSGAAHASRVRPAPLMPDRIDSHRIVATRINP
jgi:hypothetical protein